MGKTSLIKLFIAELLNSIEAKHIFYASLDSLPLEKYLVTEILTEYRKIHNLPLSDRLSLFFDEMAYRTKAHQELKNLETKAAEKYLLESYFEQYMKLGGIPEYVLTDDIN